MSIFAIHKFLFQLRNDHDFRRRAQASPYAVLDEMRLTAAERSALERGDVRTLYEMGVHGFLLLQLSNANLFGIDRATYFNRVRNQDAITRPRARA
jgi:hypothetical protein